MSTLKNKIDFIALVSVTRANSNGDPLNGNRPRTDYDGYGEISDVCVKRKLRNRMQDLGNAIFVQSEDRCGDGYGSLSERASAELKEIKDRAAYAEAACAKWLDVRAFGQVFAFKDNKGFSVGVRGPVSVHQAVSVSPVDIESLQITKSVNGEKKEKEENRASDTMVLFYGLFPSDRCGKCRAVMIYTNRNGSRRGRFLPLWAFGSRRSIRCSNRRRPWPTPWRP